MEHSISHRVLWGETDAAGIVFYPNFYRWFDRASHELFRSLGYSMERMRQEGHSLILLDTAARFRLALHYDDEIEILSRPTEIRSRSIRIEHRVMLSDVEAASGHEVRIWARVAGRGAPHADALPANLRALLS